MSGAAAAPAAAGWRSVGSVSAEPAVAGPRRPSRSRASALRSLSVIRPGSSVSPAGGENQSGPGNRSGESTDPAAMGAAAMDPVALCSDGMGNVALGSVVEGADVADAGNGEAAGRRVAPGPAAMALGRIAARTAAAAPRPGAGGRTPGDAVPVGDVAAFGVEPDVAEADIGEEGRTMMRSTATISSRTSSSTTSRRIMAGPSSRSPANRPDRPAARAPTSHAVSPPRFFLIPTNGSPAVRPPNAPDKAHIDDQLKPKGAEPPSVPPHSYSPFGVAFETQSCKEGC